MSSNRVASVVLYTIAGAMAIGLIPPGSGLPIPAAILCIAGVASLGWWVGRKS